MQIYWLDLSNLHLHVLPHWKWASTNQSQESQYAHRKVVKAFWKRTRYCTHAFESWLQNQGFRSFYHIYSTTDPREFGWWHEQFFLTAKLGFQITIVIVKMPFDCRYFYSFTWKILQSLPRKSYTDLTFHWFATI